jgi:hypothetical protein
MWIGGCGGLAEVRGFYMRFLPAVGFPEVEKVWRAPL